MDKQKDALQSELSQLFAKTGHDHHQAYIETDGDDVEWPWWYATYLQPHMAEIFNAACSRSQLVYLILSAEHEHQANDTDSPWPDAYAAYFIQHFRPRPGDPPYMRDGS